MNKDVRDIIIAYKGQLEQVPYRELYDRSVEEIKGTATELWEGQQCGEFQEYLTYGDWMLWSARNPMLENLLMSLRLIETNLY